MSEALEALSAPDKISCADNLNIAAGISLIAGSGAFLAAILTADSQVLIGGLALLYLVGIIGFRGTQPGVKISSALQTRPPLFHLALFGTAVALLLLFHNDHYALLMLATLAIFGSACSGINLQMGWAGIPNFAGAAFFSVGTYTAAVLSSLGTASLLVLLAGGLMSSIIGMMVILPVLRTRGHYAALVTIAFGLLLRIFLEVNDTFGGPQGLKIPDFTIWGISLNQVSQIGPWEISFYFPFAVASLALCTMTIYVIQRIENSWIGIRMDAVRVDEISASAFGISITRTKFAAFFVGNFILGVAGALYGYMMGFVNPNGAGFGESLTLIAIIILGGVGNKWGLFVAGAVFLVLPEKLHTFQEYKLLILSIVVVLILLFKPEGLFPRPLRVFLRGSSRAQRSAS